MHRTRLVATLTVLFTLVACSGARASGPAVKVGEPFAAESPAVAVDAAGDAILVWADTKDLAGAKDFVQWCVLPLGASACSQSGDLTPAGSDEHVDRAQVLVDGSAIIVLADVFGAKGPSAREYEPEQEWLSTDGGATFTQAAAGKSVATGIVDADTQPLNAVIVPGTGSLGYGWFTADEQAPTFNAFPLESPPQCSEESCPAGFARLEPETNPDQIQNLEGALASQAGAIPGILGVYQTNFASGPLGCPGTGTEQFGTAYVYGSGAQSASNSYNVSPGVANTAWKVAVSQADCNVEYPAVGGGPSGFGILEDNLATSQAIYHRFDQATDKFDTPPVTVASMLEQQPALSQDGSGGVYATFLDGFRGPVELAYSATGGASWSGPAMLNADPATNIEELTSAINGTGQGWAVWSAGGAVYAQPFVAADALPPPATATATATTQSSGAVSGASISIPAGTVGEKDQAQIAGANAASASGTIAYSLYSSSSCAAATKLFTSVETVSAGTAAPSAPVTAALAPGKYYWQASYSGNPSAVGVPGNDPSESACGSELLTVTPPPSAGGTATSTSTTVTITVTCEVTPCTVTVTITIPSAAAAVRHKKPKRITLASATFTLRHKGAQKLTLHLTKAGRRALHAHGGRLTASLKLTETIDGHALSTTKTLKIKPASHKHRR